MKQRAAIIAIAALLGLVAAFTVTSYANRAKQEALGQAELVNVMVAAQPLPVGLTLDELADRKLVGVREVPKEFVAEGALDGEAGMGDKVLAVGLAPGEQLTSGKFKASKDAGLAFTVPEDMVAVAIPIDDMKAAGNLVKVGDLVNVVGTAKNVDDKEFTKTVLQKVQVLAVGSSLENAEPAKSAAGGIGGVDTGGQAKAGRTVTLALSQANAEKLIFMQDQGRIWLTLLPSKKAEAVTTGGQTIDTVFE
jgi:pilus assembly protein CpaB